MSLCTFDNDKGNKMKNPKLLVAMALLIPSVSFSAGFDCARAGTNIERMICGDPFLSDLDTQLTHAYHAEVNARPETKDKLKAEQREWLAQVRNKCQDVPCLTSVYQERIKVLAVPGDIAPAPAPAAAQQTVPTDEPPRPATGAVATQSAGAPAPAAQPPAHKAGKEADKAPSGNGPSTLDAVVGLLSLIAIICIIIAFIKPARMPFPEQLGKRSREKVVGLYFAILSITLLVGSHGDLSNGFGSIIVTGILVGGILGVIRIANTKMSGSEHETGSQTLAPSNDEAPEKVVSKWKKERVIPGAIRMMIPKTKVWKWLGGCWLGLYVVNSVVGCSRHATYADASDLIKKQLRSPSSYLLVSEDDVWTGKNQSGGDKYVVRIEYDAQNGFGATIRDCKLVVLSYDKDENRNGQYMFQHFMDACAAPPMFTEDQMVHSLAKMF